MALLLAAAKRGSGWTDTERTRHGIKQRLKYYYSGRHLLFKSHLKKTVPYFTDRKNLPGQGRNSLVKANDDS